MHRCVEPWVLRSRTRKRGGARYSMVHRQMRQAILSTARPYQSESALSLAHVAAHILGAAAYPPHATAPPSHQTRAVASLRADAGLVTSLKLRLSYTLVKAP